MLQSTDMCKLLCEIMHDCSTNVKLMKHVINFLNCFEKLVNYLWCTLYLPQLEGTSMDKNHVQWVITTNHVFCPHLELCIDVEKLYNGSPCESFELHILWILSENIMKIDMIHNAKIKIMQICTVNKGSVCVFKQFLKIKIHYILINFTNKFLGSCFYNDYFIIGWRADVVQKIGEKYVYHWTTTRTVAYCCVIIYVIVCYLLQTSNRSFFYLNYFFQKIEVWPEIFATSGIPSSLFICRLGGVVFT